MSDIQVMMAAQAVAMRAMVNDLDQHTVDNMRTLAEELACGQALYRAITGFAIQYELKRRDPAALKAEGEELRDAVLAASDAPVSHATPIQRSDIDG